MTAAAWGAIAAGGAVGSVLRAAVSQWLSRGGYPYGTLAVNVVGSLLLGFFVAWLPPRAANPVAVAALTTGLCGGFTTMSTFALDVVLVWQQGMPMRAFAYAIATFVTCIAAAAVGYAIGR